MRFSEVIAVEYGAPPDAIASLARPAVRVSGPTILALNAAGTIDIRLGEVPRHLATTGPIGLTKDMLRATQGFWRIQTLNVHATNSGPGQSD